MTAENEIPADAAIEDGAEPAAMAARRWLGRADASARTALLAHTVTPALAIVGLLVAGPALATGPVMGSTPGEPAGASETTGSKTELEDGKTMTIPPQSYEVYINATPQQIWDAITTPAWSERYGYQGRVHYQLEAGGAYRAHSTAGMVAAGLPEVAIDGEVIEAVAPRKLVHTYRFLFNDDTRAEGFTRVTWEIEDTGAGFCRLTVTHQLDGAPIMAGMVSSKFSEMGGGGWGWILNDLKTVLETGKRLGEG